MKDTPILMTGEMVRAVLSGRKTQTRRVIDGVNGKMPEGLEEYQVHAVRLVDGFLQGIVGDSSDFVQLVHGQGKNYQGIPTRCPYGSPGDRLWVKETFGLIPEDGGTYVYRATGPEWGTECGLKWKPSIFMPREASRITLEITDIRVERVQDISEEDARAEGAEREFCPEDDDSHLADADERAAGYSPPKSFCAGFKNLWDSINAKRDGGIYSWERNPWVWVISFKRIEPALNFHASEMIDEERRRDGA